ncbi:hypothetical protein QFC19_003043 [Naganishia cerealis]|uniref:Uncharacterized protein n=1 Tax=Naganishia cerealis TaxID=610337 RepID=A0ACC2W5N1_9TREE|nr:hypothetical protein QFC19_003043 [Naganishia cerealis]
MSKSTQSWEPSVAIIGAGCSGIILGLKLKAIGFHNFVIYERDSDVGGTWLTNTYPVSLYRKSSHGAYSNSKLYTIARGVDANWQKLARDNGLYEHCQFRTSFINAKWDDSTSSYRIRLKEGTRFGPDAPDSQSINNGRSGAYDGQIVEKEHNVLVSCIGGFSFPLIPKMNGLPNPYKDDKPILEKPDEILARFSHAAATRDDLTEQHGEDKFKGLVLHPSRWPRQGVDLHDKKVIVFGNGCSGQKVESIAQALPFPRIYPIGMCVVVVPLQQQMAKRYRGEGAEYLESLSKPNVETVTSPVERFTEHGFVTADGTSHEVDVVVLATGYDVTASTLDVTGRDGLRASTAILGDDSPRGYRGLALPKFPNHWLCLSLNTAPGHGSVLTNIEVQAAYITQCINAMRTFGVKVLEVKEEPTREYNAWLDRRLENTVWAKGSSFYRLGKERNGRIFTNWPAPIALYWWQNSSPKWQDWIGADQIAAKAQSRQRRMMVDIALALVGLAYFWTKFGPKWV